MEEITTDSPDSLVLDINVVRESMRLGFKTFGKANYMGPEKKAGAINKVVHSVRSANETAYTPKMIAIGPYHHNNDILKPMDALKWTYLRALVARNSEVNKLEKYIDLIGENKDEIISFYPELVTKDINDFIQMIVLDGCFLVEFLVRDIFWEHLERLMKEPVKYHMLMNDLLLIENQIPIMVLQLLFDASNIPILKQFDIDDSPAVTLMNVIAFFVKRQSPSDTIRTLVKNKLSNQRLIEKNKFSNHSPEEKSEREWPKKNQEIYHILHAFHGSHCLPSTRGSTKHKNIFSKCFASLVICKDDEDETTNSWMRTIYHILHAFHGSLCLPSTRGNTKYKNIFSKCFASLMMCKDNEDETKMPSMDFMGIPIIPSATQLQEAGIKLKLKHDATNILDVTFHRKSGILELPDIDLSMIILQNLLTFENSIQLDVDHCFLAYAVLMSCLIDTAADVSIFKENHIILHSYGSNEEVAVFFNRLCDSSFFYFNRQMYKELFEDVNDYYRIKRHRWKAGFVRTYFASPWSAISLVAAFILLALTILQTFYTVFPYYHPRG